MMPTSLLSTDVTLIASETLSTKLLIMEDLDRDGRDTQTMQKDAFQLAHCPSMLLDHKPEASFLSLPTSYSEESIYKIKPI